MPAHRCTAYSGIHYDPGRIAMSRTPNAPNPANPPAGAADSGRLSTAARDLLDAADREGFRPPWLVERLAAIRDALGGPGATAAATAAPGTAPAQAQAGASPAAGTAGEAS
jgi:hypothetical protein